MNTDKQFMKLALKEARKGLEKDDYPVGAVIAIDGKLLAKGNNSLVSSNKGITHAEMNIINSYSSQIINAARANKKVVLYTTLEPCLMCLGTSVLHRISRIVYACPDPDGGSVELIKQKRKGYYLRRWPIIQGGLYAKESHDLLISFLKKQTSPGWKAVLLNMTKNMEVKK